MGDVFSPPNRVLSLKDEAAARKSKLTASASSRPSFTSSSASWHSEASSSGSQYNSHHHQPLHASYSQIPSNSYYGNNSSLSSSSSSSLSSSMSSLPPSAPTPLPHHQQQQQQQQQHPPSYLNASSATNPSPPSTNQTQQQLVAAARKSWTDKTLGGLDPSGAGQSLEDRRSYLQNLTFSSPPPSSSSSLSSSLSSSSSFSARPAAPPPADVDPSLAYATRLVCSERRLDLACVPYQTYIVKVIPPSSAGRPNAEPFQVEHRFSSFFKLDRKLAEAVRRREATLPPPPDPLSDLSGNVEVTASVRYQSAVSSLSRVSDLHSLFPSRTFSVLSSPSVPPPSCGASCGGPASLSGSARVVAGRELALDRWLLAVCECLARRDVQAVSATAVRDVVTFLNVGDKDVLPCERENKLRGSKTTGASASDGGDDDEDDDDENNVLGRHEPRAKSMWESSLDALWRSAPSNPLTFTLGSAIRSAAHAVDALADPSSLDSSIPLDLLRHAAGIAFLTVVKGGLFVTARVGTGLIVRRIGERAVPATPGQKAAYQLPVFSPPSAIGTVGLGYGWAGGADVSSVVIILTTDKAVKSFSQAGTVTFGGELAVAIGPLGRTANGGLSKGIGSSGSGVPASGGSAGGGAGWEAAAAGGERWFESMYPSPAYSYSHSKGLFAGVSLEGSVVAPRADVNHRFYGRTFEVGQILGGDTLRMVRRDEGDALAQAAGRGAAGGGGGGGAAAKKLADSSKRDSHVACWPLYDAIDRALTPPGDEWDTDERRNMAQQAFSAAATAAEQAPAQPTTGRSTTYGGSGDGDRPMWSNPNGGRAEPNPFARAPLAAGINRY